jgi:dTDP-4-amino-4,6-dideoxygalactose transaminase
MEIPEIAIARPKLGAEEEAAVTRVLRSGWLTQGPEVAAFETEFAAYVGAKYACAVSSATTGLHLALLAAGVGPGDEVITVSHSFIATANAIRYCGATPVFVDIKAGTFNIDPKAVERAIGPKTKAILTVHQIGIPCDLAALTAIASKAGLPLIEDAACAIGSKFRGEIIGKPHGISAVFSFHPRKVLTTGDGGMITTSDPAMNAFFRTARQHGMSVNDLERHRSKTIQFEHYEKPGFNYRMTDLQAAVGRVQLKRLPELLEDRNRIAARYQLAFAGLRGIDIPRMPEYATPNWQSYGLLVTEESPKDRNALMTALLELKISTRRGIMCSHREPAYQDERLRFPLPESEAMQDHSILLPIHSQMSEADVDRVIQSITDLMQAAPSKARTR